jgi:hypothetical protein
MLKYMPYYNFALLKKDYAMNILKHFYLLLLLIFITGCSSSSMMASSALKNNEISLSNYKYVTIYDSKEASFMELELENLMESNGLKVIGKGDAKKYRKGTVLGTRYTEDHIRNGYGNPIGTTFTISLEDFSSDKTLLTVNAQQQYMGREAAWKEVSQKLDSALKMY